MSWLITTSLRLRLVIVVLSAVLIVFGIRALDNAPLDVFPEFAPPLVEIQTEAPGLSTREVETLVTMPLEHSLNGIPFVDAIRSKSVLGLSSIRLIFKDGTDLIRARQLVQERLAVEATRLPKVAKPPVMMPPKSSTSRILMIGISSEELSQMDLTILARWTIRPRLMGIPGVGNVAIWGEREREFQVQVDPNKLQANQISLAQVEKATTEAAKLTGGGFVDTPNQRLPVQQVTGIHKPEDLEDTVVDYRGGVAITIGDVANVVEGSPPPIGDAVINDGPGLLLIVEKEPWGNTLEITQRIEEELDILRPGLQGVELDPTIFRPATFIERSLDNLMSALYLGCVLVVIVLVMFLFDWRTSLISIVAIPLSLVSASVVLYLLGTTLNTMVIAGLVIALGEVVDDAIIDVENILRRLRLNKVAVNPQPVFKVVLNASLEVRSAVVYASLIVTLVFVPVLFMGGLAGSFFRPLAISYILAILASLVVALTVTPALSLMFLPSAARKRTESPLTRMLQRGYGNILPLFLNKPRTAIACLGVMLLATVGLSFTLGEEFLPDFKESDFLMHWVEKPGTSNDAMKRVTVLASKDLRKIPGVRNFGAHLGRAEVADEVVGQNFTELWISVDEKVNLEETTQKIQEVVDNYPGLYRDVLTYLKEIIKEVLTGAKASIVVRVYGDNLEKLRNKAQEVGAVMGKVKGVHNLKVEPQTLVPQIQVRVRPGDAKRFGLSPGKIRQTVQIYLRGLKVGEIYEDQKSYPVVVWSVPEIRQDLASLRMLPIELPVNITPVPESPVTATVTPQPKGLKTGYVRLKDVADVEIVPTPNEILREGASRRIDITCDAKGRDLGSVAREIEEKVKELPFDRGYHPEFLGEYAERQQSQWQLYTLSALSLIGILLLLYVDFKSWKLTLLVAVTIPFSLVGGVIAVALTDGNLSLGSLVGFVTVLGIAARNGIMLLSHYRHLETEEGEPFGMQLVLRGSLERLAPILMTVLTTGLALLPLVLWGNRPGNEIEYPMAVVILGGLLTSTLLNLFLFPPIYAAFGRVQIKSDEA